MKNVAAAAQFILQNFLHWSVLLYVLGQTLVSFFVRNGAYRSLVLFVYTIAAFAAFFCPCTVFRPPIMLRARTLAAAFALVAYAGVVTAAAAVYPRRRKSYLIIHALMHGTMYAFAFVSFYFFVCGNNTTRDIPLPDLFK